jgi:hypothetical protein
MKIQDLNKRLPGKLNGFYRGVVEDNADPLKMGRVRIRVFGIHTHKKIKTKTEGIPTDELPWAEPVLPMVEGGVTGFGMWSVPVQGSHVMVFYEQGDLMMPRYFGTLPGFPVEIPDKTKGFSDPTGTYPTTRLNEPDYHRLARGVSDQTGVTRKNGNRKLGVVTAGGASWSEPESPYGAEYPHNFVMAFHGGLIMEFDSTPNNTRINIHHLQSNSYIEIDQDGNMVIRNSANRYDVVKGGTHNEWSELDRNITSNGKVTIYAKDDVNITTEGDANVTATGDVDITATGDVNVQGSTINLN